MRNLLPGFVILAAASTLAACAVSEIGKNFDESQLTQFRKGQTTFDEAEKWLGRPSNSVLSAKGNWIHNWSFIRAEANGLTSEVSTRNKAVTLVFGADGKFIGVAQYQGISLSAQDRERLLAVPPQGQQRGDQQ